MLVLKQLDSQPAAYGRPAELLQLMSVLLGHYEHDKMHQGLDGPEEVSAALTMCLARNRTHMQATCLFVPPRRAHLHQSLDSATGPPV